MDTLDIIRQLQADPALKAELRAVLLGEEVLGLPELVKDNSRQIAALTVRMERVDEQIAENSRQIAALTEAVRAHDARLESVEVSINALIDHQAEMQSSIRFDIQDLARMSAQGVAAMQQGFLEMREGFVVVNERIDGLDTKFTAKFDQIDARLDESSSKIDGLDTKFTAKFDQVESEIRDVKSDIGDLRGKTNGLIGDVTEMKRDLGNIKRHFGID